MSARATDPADEFPHADLVDEWVFATWQPDAGQGLISGHRLFRTHSWYWAALVEAGRPVLHLTEWEAPRRRDPFIVKAPEMWAEHTCDAPLEQWAIGNEAHFVALDDPADALAGAYGHRTPMAADLEWYATAPAESIAHGYHQAGVVHGVIEVGDRPHAEFAEAPAHRWRRFAPTLGPLTIEATAATRQRDLRALFGFPDATVGDYVLTAVGWRSRLADDYHSSDGAPAST